MLYQFLMVLNISKSSTADTGYHLLRELFLRYYSSSYHKIVINQQGFPCSNCLLVVCHWHWSTMCLCATCAWPWDKISSIFTTSHIFTNCGEMPIRLQKMNQVAILFYKNSKMFCFLALCLKRTCRTLTLQNLLLQQPKCYRKLTSQATFKTSF